jgi:hypothetical protein
MILDTKKTILRINLSNFIVTVVVLILIIVLLFVPFRIDLIKGVDNNLMAIFVAIAYVINVFYRNLRNYNYIYFSDESDKIIFRYFANNLFTSKKNSIEFPKKEFTGYELHSFFLRYREKLVLLRRTSKGIAKYPAVSITALNNDERNSLLFTLNQLKWKNE